MAQAIRVEVDGGLATLRIGRGHGNAINGELVEELMTAAHEVEADDDVRGVLLTSTGSLFSPGLDVQELAAMDRPALAGFMRRFATSLLMLYTLPKPLVAALQGHAIAGGCVLSLTADWRILKRGCEIGLNEIRVGVPLPFGVSMMLRESVNPNHVEEIALFGRNYADEQALEAGLVHELHGEEGFEEFARSRLDELASRDRQSFSITKRYLRSATVERIRANDAQFADEFLDAWFSPSSQQRIQALAAKLGGSGKSP